MRHLTVIAVAANLLLLPAALSWPEAPAREPVIGAPCEGCELVFEGCPENLSSVSRIAPADEPGELLRIEGTVRDQRGNAVGGVVVYAYHTNARGLYPRGQTRHGRLRGWAKSDETGHYRFDTIRPAGYPDAGTPQHVHMHVIEPGRGTYYIDDILFDDDPRLAAAMRRQAPPGRGGPGVVTPRREETGRWVVERDIVLGLGLPSYQTAGAGTGSDTGIRRVAWLTGTWEMLAPAGSPVRRTVEEHWRPPLGNTMLGLGRTVRGDSLIEYEFLVLREEGPRLAYDAHPSGQPPVVFMSRTLNDSTAIFENLEHDFPQVVGYSRRGADSLLAWIEGTPPGGRARRIEFPYRRATSR